MIHGCMVGCKEVGTRESFLVYIHKVNTGRLPTIGVFVCHVRCPCNTFSINCFDLGISVQVYLSFPIIPFSSPFLSFPFLFFSSFFLPFFALKDVSLDEMLAFYDLSAFFLPFMEWIWALKVTMSYFPITLLSRYHKLSLFWNQTQFAEEVNRKIKHL
jgi:hypothetical protein